MAFVLAMASHLRFKEHYRKFGGLIIALFVAIPPMFLILIEPDLGTAMLFLPSLIAMLVAAGAKISTSTMYSIACDHRCWFYVSTTSTAPKSSNTSTRGSI